MLPEISRNRVAAYASCEVTVRTYEPNWAKAHHMPLPAFGQRAMQGYHAMMVDLAEQLVQKWPRLNPDERVHVPEDMTRLTLDTIGLRGFSYPR